MAEVEKVICEVCGKPKSAIMKMFGKDFVMPCVCDCQKNAEQNELAISQKRELENRKNKLMRSYISGNGLYADSTFENDDKLDKNATAFAREYASLWGTNDLSIPPCFRVKPIGNRGIVLSGKPGTGKTFLAACICNYLVRQGFDCAVYSIPTLIDKLLQGKTEDVLSAVEKPDLLTLDDLGVEAKSESKLEKLYQIVNTRYSSGKPCIYTTNIPIGAMVNSKSIAYARIYRRVLAHNIHLQMECVRKEY